LKPPTTGTEYTSKGTGGHLERGADIIVQSMLPVYSEATN